MDVSSALPPPDAHAAHHARRNHAAGSAWLPGHRDRHLPASFVPGHGVVPSRICKAPHRRPVRGSSAKSSARLLGGIDRVAAVVVGPRPLHAAFLPRPVAQESGRIRRQSLSAGYGDIESGPWSSEVRQPRDHPPGGQLLDRPITAPNIPRSHFPRASRRVGRRRKRSIAPLDAPARSRRPADTALRAPYHDLDRRNGRCPCCMASGSCPVLRVRLCSS